MSQEQGNRLADMASQTALAVDKAKHSIAATGGSPALHASMQTSENEAANLAARAADQLKGK